MQHAKSCNPHWLLRLGADDVGGVAHHELGNALDKSDTVSFCVDIASNVRIGVVPNGEPSHNLSHLCTLTAVGR